MSNTIDGTSESIYLLYVILFLNLTCSKNSNDTLDLNKSIKVVFQTYMKLVHFDWNDEMTFFTW